MGSEMCIRDSHGTAFDIAGKGKANERGLESAIRAAHLIVDKNLNQF